MKQHYEKLKETFIEVLEELEQQYSVTLAQEAANIGTILMTIKNMEQGCTCGNKQAKKQSASQSDFATVFTEKMELNPDKTLAELETFINLMFQLHPDRFSQFIARLKEIK